MPQLHLYVMDDLAEALRRRAEAEGKTVSRYLADLVRRDLGGGWPEGWFETVVGGWQGEPPERGEPGQLEQRDSF